MIAHCALFALFVAAGVAMPPFHMGPGPVVFPGTPIRHPPIFRLPVPVHGPTGVPHAFDSLSPEASFRVIEALFKKMSHGKPTDFPETLPTEFPAEISTEFEDMDPEACMRAIKALFAKVFGAHKLPEGVPTGMPDMDGIGALIAKFENLFRHRTGAPAVPTEMSEDASTSQETTEEPGFFPIHFPHFDFFDKFADFFKKAMNMDQATASPLGSKESNESGDNDKSGEPKKGNFGRHHGHGHGQQREQ